MTLDTVNGTASVIRWAEVLVPARQLAEVIAGTDFVPKAMRDRPDVVTAAIMYGDEIGVSPMEALRSIHLVEGRPVPSAELMRGLIYRAGHSMSVLESTGTRCRVAGVRRGRPEAERLVVEWNLDMARAAGLLGRPVWQRYPRAMLMARATSDLARALFPDAIKGLGYMAEDEAEVSTLEAWAPAGEESRPEQPARQPVRRRTPPRVRALEAAPASPLTTNDAPTEEVTSSEPQDSPEPVAQPSHSDPIDQPVRVSRGRHVAATSEEEPPPPEPIAPPEAPASSLAETDAGASRPIDVGYRAAGVVGQVMPDLEPEAPAPEPTAGPKPISDGMRRGLMMSWRKVAPVEVNRELDRMRRLECWSALLGKEVTSSKTLSRDDAFRLAQELARVEDGKAVLVESEEGWLRLRAYPEPLVHRPAEGEVPLWPEE